MCRVRSWRVVTTLASCPTLREGTRSSSRRNKWAPVRFLTCEHTNRLSFSPPRRTACVSGNASLEQTFGFGPLFHFFFAHAMMCPCSSWGQSSLVSEPMSWLPLHGRMSSQAGLQEEKGDRASQRNVGQTGGGVPMQIGQGLLGPVEKGSGKGQETLPI